ncbi:class I SAM-dependent methyltransferase [Mycolicibacterium sp. S2-37]|uniref:O-methyltransferase n=1 Tax=Mycolicibacterium sp. S2-37 TaxID=2810297 RepID=UPI001A94AA0E|nr:class I SAM-dependent methyltransferase [Mycolicibacterium sp. S2-37]MBO0681352.1 class I SAM-dependent methyltransferase [Mycolicibacterium sp. S2-37]
MNSLQHPRVTAVLERLFGEAEVTDAPYIAELLGRTGPDGDPLERLLEDEARDYRSLYHDAAGNFLCVSAEFGRLLYVCAAACAATRVVEFGTSFGVSTIHLACAVRDNGGGQVISTELEPTKAARAGEHLAEAGLADLVEIRVGDALDTLRDGLGGPVDLVHLDGAFSLYLPVLRLLEPYLRPQAVVIAENGTAGYVDYVRDPGNGYVTLTLDADRGNELSLFTRAT